MQFSSLLIGTALFVSAFSAPAEVSSESPNPNLKCYVGDAQFHHIKKGFTHCIATYVLNQENEATLSGGHSDPHIDNLHYVHEFGSRTIGCSISLNQDTDQFEAKCKCTTHKCNTPKIPKVLFDEEDLSEIKQKKPQKM